jgi:hypothetical protein
MTLDYDNAARVAREQVRKHKQKQQQGPPKGNGASPSMGYTLLRDLKPNLTNNDIIKSLIPRNAFVEAHAVAVARPPSSSISRSTSPTAATTAHAASRNSRSFTSPSKATPASITGSSPPPKNSA